MPDIDPKLKELIEATRTRVEAQKTYYEQGRLTLDRYNQGLVALCDLELLAATTDAERSAIFQRRKVAELQNERSGGRRP